MMTKEKFINLISEHQKYNKRLDEVCKVLDVDLWEADWVEYANVLFDTTIGLLFTDEGQDTISWWLYEKDGRPDMKMWDLEDNEIPTETLDDLWEIVKSDLRQ
ncbi:hypothetical protein [Intestinibacter sp.]|uniref:hypothetical protein n=1 Tax=Intestinibacter sp. TaxID=1965304 RepID=UPI003F14841F